MVVLQGTTESMKNHLLNGALQTSVLSGSSYLSVLCHVVVHGAVGSLTMRRQQDHHLPVVFGLVGQGRRSWTGERHGQYQVLFYLQQPDDLTVQSSPPYWYY